MGGHNAWRKRVKNGLLAKEGGGGAICRHRPRLGRRGKDLILNRKGYIGGGSNKKKKMRERLGIIRNVSGKKSSNGDADMETKEQEVISEDSSSIAVPNESKSMRMIALRILFVFIATKVYWYVQSKYRS
jgi:hypothetical protein